MAWLTKGKRVFISGALLAVAFLIKRLAGLGAPAVVFMLAATVMAGTPIFAKAIGALKYGLFGIEALVTIAVTGAVLIGEYWEAAAVTFLFLLGDYLEARTIEKTRASIKALLALAPDRARVRREGAEVEVAPAEVRAGEVVVVKPGEKIAVDGTVFEGAAYVNQAAITGEPLPVSRRAGEAVFAGTIVETGYLLVKAERVGEETTFARILALVEEAQDKKAKTQKFLERFSRFYTPGIILLAVLMYVITRDLSLALTLLVIACPGALVISTPVSIVAGIGNGARRGVLVKGGEVMEKLGTVKVVAFDKTGTLTVGQPEVTGVKAYGCTEQDVLRLAAIGEAYSEHPLAKAIIRRAREELGPLAEAPEETEHLPGQGLKFRRAGVTYYLGNRKLFVSSGIDLGSREDDLRAEEEKGRTTVLLGTAAGLCGIISIADVLRDEARTLVAGLKAQGVNKVVMLTGDNRRTAAALAAETGLDEYYSELLPEDKVRVLAELQKKYGRTAMVGDGVNDAPALAAADIGIAVGGGTDVAMETADVVLMTAALDRLVYAIGLSRATVRNMKQNITFALLVAALLLAGVLVKTVNLAFGMLVHEVSVLLVTVNAARLLGYGRRKNRV